MYEPFKDVFKIKCRVHDQRKFYSGFAAHDQPQGNLNPCPFQFLLSNKRLALQFAHLGHEHGRIIESFEATRQLSGIGERISILV